LLPCDGEVDGVLPLPPVPEALLFPVPGEAPPPEPPFTPFVAVGKLLVAPPPPPADVLALNTEFEPLVPFTPPTVEPVPPAPTVTVNAVPIAKD
jgi:hypothetical protein